MLASAQNLCFLSRFPCFSF